MINKLCFTTCLDEKFIPGATGLIKSIRKFYSPNEADIVLFINKQVNDFELFCEANKVELHYFATITGWVLEKIYARDIYKHNQVHYYHPHFAPHAKVPYEVNQNRETGFHKLRHLHPLNVKAYCTGYCILQKEYTRVVHIDSDAFLLSRIDELYTRYPDENTVIVFQDRRDALPNLEYLYQVKKPADWSDKTFSFNAGIVFYVNGPHVKRLVEDFCFYIESCYHYDKSGILTLRNQFDMKKTWLFELRAKMASGVGNFPAFWLTGWPEVDIFENGIDADADAYRTTSSIIPNDQTSHCGMFFYKQSPCGYPDDWHTYDCIFSNSEIIFFVDGKEKWSTLNTYAYLGTPSNGYLTINNAITAWAGFSSSQMQLDYVRCYTPLAGANTTPVSLQNIQSGYAKTLENLTSTGNYSQMFVPASLMRTTHQVQPGSRITTAGIGSAIRVFYNATNSACCFASLQVGSTGLWTDNIIKNATITYDIEPGGQHIQSGIISSGVKNFITPTADGRIYYQSTLNELKYFTNTANTWADHYAIATNSPYNQTGHITNCKGPVFTDALNQIWYKGTDNNIWLWQPATGRLTAVISDGSVVGALAISNTGLYGWYTDASHNLRQFGQINFCFCGVTGWATFSLPPCGKVANYLAVDESKARVYFIGTDNSVGYYNYGFAGTIPNNPFFLNTTTTELQNANAICSQYNNAAANLYVDSRTGLVYYVGLDGNIWYYFNDNDPYNLNASTGNWNHSILYQQANAFIRSGVNNSSYMSTLALENTNFGRLFYATGPLSCVSWANADNPLTCPDANNNQYQLKNDVITTTQPKATEIPKVPEIDSVLNSTTPVLNIYPNPSNKVFILILSNLAKGQMANVNIEDLSGRTVYHIQNTVLDDNKLQFIWNAQNISSGIYFYAVKIEHETFTGKLIKI